MNPLPPPGLGAPAVLDAIARAARRAGRDPASITLVAAAKTHTPERTLAAGVCDVGHNRVQELLAAQDALAAFPIRWHFIGRLQRNKVRSVAGRVTLIHSIDSIELASAVGRAAADAGAVQDVLIQVNVSSEPSKGGVALGEAGTLARRAESVEGIAVRGLMAIPAPGDPAAIRTAFRAVTEAAAAAGLPHVSIGMSDDYEIAVEEGATIVRVGTAIFGPREAGKPG